MKQFTEIKHQLLLKTKKALENLIAISKYDPRADKMNEIRIQTLTSKIFKKRPLRNTCVCIGHLICIMHPRCPKTEIVRTAIQNLD